MNKCPITYEPCEKRYSEAGLKKLSRQLTHLEDLPLSAEELRREAVQRATKMSIQGVQAKLSAVLNVRNSSFDIVDSGGRFILKPQSYFYSEMPENEDLTMHLAEEVGIEVPLHGLVYAKDGSLTYFIRRFDRDGRTGKFHVEDFAQLAGKSRDTKYDFSMEKLIPIIDAYCSFPIVQRADLFKRTVFNFMVGNEDMHLKNFSLLTKDEIVSLAPAYDFVNSTIAMSTPREEMALPLKGKKSGITRANLIDYFGKERLSLTDKVINQILSGMENAIPSWNNWIKRSFLSDKMKDAYRELFLERCDRLQIKIPS